MHQQQQHTAADDSGVVASSKLSPRDARGPQSRRSPGPTATAQPQGQPLLQAVGDGGEGSTSTNTAAAAAAAPARRRTRPSSGSSSILQAQLADHGSTGALPAERALQDGLSRLRSEIAKKTVKQVEAQLLQQRVAHLEAVLAGMSLSGRVQGAGPLLDIGSTAGSLAGGPLLGGGAAVRMRSPSSAPQGQQLQQSQQQQRVSAGISFLELGACPAGGASSSDAAQLFDRLGDMEAAVRELAQAQAASTAVLSQLGSQMPPSPNASPADRAAAGPQHRPPSPAVWPLPASPRHPWAASTSVAWPGRPTDGGPSASSSPQQASQRSRQPSARASLTPEPLLRSPAQPLRSSTPVAGAGLAPDSAGGAWPQHQAWPHHAHGELHHHQHQQHQQHQQQQAQPQWLVDLVLSQHDAELAAVRDDVRQLQEAQHDAAAAADSTAAHVSGLEARVQELEQHAMAATLPATPLTHSADGGRGLAAGGQRSISFGGGPSASAGASSSSGGGQLDAADLVSAIEGLADDAAQAGARLSALEAASQQHARGLQDVQDALAHGQHAPAAGGPAGAAAVSTQAVCGALLGSEALSQMLERLVAAKVEQALAAVLPAAAHDCTSTPPAPAAAAPVDSSSSPALAALDSAFSSSQLTSAVASPPLDQAPARRSVTWFSGLGEIEEIAAQLEQAATTTDGALSAAAPPEDGDGGRGGAAVHTTTVLPAAPPAAAGASAYASAASSRSPSTRQLDADVADLTQEVAGCQLLAMHEALEALAGQVQALHRGHEELATLLAAHKASAGASLALLVPLDGRVAGLAARADDMAARLDEVGAAGERSHEHVTAQLAELQEQQAATLERALAAAASASASAELEARLADEHARCQAQHDSAHAALQDQIIAVSDVAAAAADRAGSVDKLAAQAQHMRAQLSGLEARVHSAVASADSERETATAAHAQLAAQLASQDASVAGSTAAMNAQLAEQAAALRSELAEQAAALRSELAEAQTRHDASASDLQAQLEQQQEAGQALILAETSKQVQDTHALLQRQVGDVADAVGELHTTHAARLEVVEGRLAPLQAQAAAIATTLRDHAASLQDAAALAGMPAAVDRLAAGLDQALQGQAAAALCAGELAARMQQHEAACARLGANHASLAEQCQRCNEQPDAGLRQHREACADRLAALSADVAGIRHDLQARRHEEDQHASLAAQLQALEAGLRRQQEALAGMAVEKQLLAQASADGWSKLQAAVDASRAAHASPHRAVWQRAFSGAPVGSLRDDAAAGLTAVAAATACPEPDGVFDPFAELSCRGTASVEQQQPGGAVGEAASPVALPPPAAAATGSEDVPQAVSAALEQLQQEVGVLAAQMQAVLPEVAAQLSTMQQHVEAAQSTQAAVIEPGVLHAPLSLVVQLQTELQDMRERAVSRQQMAAVVKLVKELRAAAQQAAAPAESCGDAGVSGPRAEEQAPEVGADRDEQQQGPAPQDDNSPAALPNAPTTEACDDVGVTAAVPREPPAAVQLAALEARCEALAQRLELLERAGADEAGSASRAGVTAQLQHLAEQHAGLAARLHALSAGVDDLATKLASTAALAVSNQAARSGGGAHADAPGGFREVMAGVSSLKACLDEQSGAVADLTARLDAQEELLRSLQQEEAPQAQQSGGSAAGVDAAAHEELTEPLAAAAAGGNGTHSVALSNLVAELLVVQARVAALEQPHTAAGGGDAPRLAEPQHRVAKVEAAVAATTAAASTAPALREHTPAGAAASACSSPARTPRAVSSRRGAAWDNTCSLEGLQEAVAALQVDVARLDGQDASLTATLDCLRGDVGAAAAAAAAASAAAAAVSAAAGDVHEPPPAAAPASSVTRPELEEVRQQLLGQLAELQAAWADAHTIQQALQAEAEAEPGAGAGDTSGGVPAAAGVLCALRADVAATAQRLASMEAAHSEQAAVLRQLAGELAHVVADAPEGAARAAAGGALAGRVAGVLPALLARLDSLETSLASAQRQLVRSLAIARQGLDVLADQLVALGALGSGRAGSPTARKNPLAALGPHHGALTALEGTVEAVRTALTASVRLMMEELGTAKADLDREASAAAAGAGQRAGSAAELAARVAALTEDGN